jgi:phage terminase Nu1 subunit (DNA packaging protein)
VTTPTTATTADVVLTLSDFAEHIDVAPSYVTKLKHAGRLVLTDDGRVQVEASKARIKETEGAYHAGVREHWDKRRKKAADVATGGDDSPPEESETPEDDSDQRSTAYWNRREAAARAQMRELELEQASGTLVKTAVVQAAGAEVGATLRAGLESMCDQLSPALVAINDEAKIHALLSEHVEMLLTEIAAKLEGMGRAPRETPEQ